MAVLHEGNHNEGDRMTPRTNILNRETGKTVTRKYNIRMTQRNLTDT